MKTVWMSILLIFPASFADAQMASGPINLDAPQLGAHAALTQNNPPWRFRPLEDQLAEARPGADARGIPWKGLRLVVGDETVAITPSALTCRADLIVTGHALASRSHLSTSGAAIYSDYDFATESVLKGYRAGSVAVGTHIVITRPGGNMTLKNGPLNYQPEGFPRLEPTVLYLLFLRYIPQSGAWQAFDSHSTFAMIGSNWRDMRYMRYAAAPGYPRESFESEIVQWSQSCK